MDRSYLNLANKVFVSDKYSLNDDFSKTARSFKSEVDSINFANTQDAARIMNEWVSDEKIFIYKEKRLCSRRGVVAQACD